MYPIRFRRPASSFLTMALVCVAAFLTSPLGALENTPPSALTKDSVPYHRNYAAVSAVVVKSWGLASDGLAFAYLNTNWAMFGAMAVSIDYSTLHAVGSFTLTDLENTGADVVIVSDAAGGAVQWTPDEVAALAAYAAQGHNLVGTYALLYYGADNRALAPLWGLRPDLEYNGVEIPAASSMAFTAPKHCLLQGIEDPLEVGGYPFVQVPADESWDPVDLAGAQFVARSPDGKNVVTEFNAGTYRAFYISYMPEFQDGSSPPNLQYLYNAIVCGRGPTPAASSTWGRIKTLYR